MAPVTERLKFSVGVEDALDTVSVEEPEPPLTEEGLKLAVAPLGNPLTLSATVLLNPPCGAREMV